MNTRFRTLFVLLLALSIISAACAPTPAPSATPTAAPTAAAPELTPTRPIRVIDAGDDPSALQGTLVTLTKVGVGPWIVVRDESGEVYIQTTLLLGYEYEEDPSTGLRGRVLATLPPGWEGEFAGVISLEPREKGFFVTITEPNGGRTREEEDLAYFVSYKLYEKRDLPAYYWRGQRNWLEVDAEELLDPGNLAFSPAEACRLIRENAWMLEYTPSNCGWNTADPLQSWEEFRAVYGAEQFVAPEESAVIVLFTLPEDTVVEGYLWCAAETPAPIVSLYRDTTRPIDLGVYFKPHWLVLEGVEWDYPLPEDGWVAFGPAVTDESAEFDLGDYKVYAIGRWDHELDCTN